MFHICTQTKNRFQESKQPFDINVTLLNVNQCQYIFLRNLMTDI